MRGEDIFRTYAQNYESKITPLFNIAKEKNEYEFVFTLLGVKSMQGAGWDPFENIQQVVKTLESLLRKRKNDGSFLHLSLFMYGLIIEASEPYEVLANLLNIIDGGRYNTCNFPPKKGRDQYPNQKIKNLQDRAKNLGFDFSLFDEVVNNRLRNAVFHSDYSTYQNRVRYDGTEYSSEEFLKKINQVSAYFHTIDGLRSHHIASYVEPQLIDVPENVAHFKNQKAQTIVRKKHGLIGLAESFDENNKRLSNIKCLIGNFKHSDDDLIKRDIFMLPECKIEKINKFLRKLPIPVAKFFIKTVFRKYQ